MGIPRGRHLAPALALLAAPLLASPCATPDHRAFDFWLGEWNVFTPDGKLAGTNRIEREIGGCVLHERYETPKGYRGESFNAYDSARRVWHQTWIDNQGLLLVVEGGLRDGSMVLEGRAPGADGGLVPHRITWTPNADGSVRQHWQTSGPDGTWSTLFDGTYRRR